MDAQFVHGILGLNDLDELTQIARIVHVRIEKVAACIGSVPEWAAEEIRCALGHAVDELLVVELPEADGTVGVKRIKRQESKTLVCSSNPDFEDVEYEANEVKIIGKVVTVLRKI